jgi:hypothetical protein
MASPVRARIAAELESGLTRLGVTLQPFHSLQRMIESAKWLASLGRDLHAAALRLPTDAEKDRFLRSLVTMEQAKRIAGSLSMPPRIRGGDLAARWMKDRVERFASRTSTFLRNVASPCAGNRHSAAC